MNLVDSKKVFLCKEGESTFFQKKSFALHQVCKTRWIFKTWLKKTCKTNVLGEDLQLDYLGEGLDNSSTELSTASKRKIDRPAGFEEGVAVSLFCLS